jgi:hypothetical protein
LLGEKKLFKDEKSMNIKEDTLNLEMSFDPFYRKTRSMFDAGTADGLLFNNLNVNSNLLISLDSDILSKQENWPLP